MILHEKPSFQCKEKTRSPLRCDDYVTSGARRARTRRGLTRIRFVRSNHSIEYLYCQFLFMICICCPKCRFLPSRFRTSLSIVDFESAADPTIWGLFHTSVWVQNGHFQSAILCPESAQISIPAYVHCVLFWAKVRGVDHSKTKTLLSANFEIRGRSRANGISPRISGYLALGLDYVGLACARASQLPGSESPGFLDPVCRIA